MSEAASRSTCVHGFLNAWRSRDVVVYKKRQSIYTISDFIQPNSYRLCKKWSGRIIAKCDSGRLINCWCWHAFVNLFKSQIKNTSMSHQIKNTLGLFLFLRKFYTFPVKLSKKNQIQAPNQLVSSSEYRFPVNFHGEDSQVTRYSLINSRFRDFLIFFVQLVLWCLERVGSGEIFIWEKCVKGVRLS